jgi:hypothetical protein
MNVTIASLALSNEPWHGLSSLVLRGFIKRPYISAASVPMQQSGPYDACPMFIEFACSIASNGTITIAEGIVVSTTDAVVPEGVDADGEWHFYFYGVDTNGVAAYYPFSIAGEGLLIPAVTPTTWGALAAYNVPMAVPNSFAGTGTGYTSITLTWAESVTAASFDVERWNGSAWGSPTSIAGGTFTMVDTGLDVAASYQYRIRAIRADGRKSAWSETVTASTPELPVPASWRIADTAETEIDVTWSDISGTDGLGIDGTSIEKAIGSGSFSVVGTVTDTSGVKAVTGLTGGLTYRLRARYYLGSHFGPYTEILTQVTPVPVIPATPSAPVATYVTDHISVAFTLPTGATGGKLYRKVGAGSYAFLSNVTTSPYSDSAITDETDYTYKLSATNTAGESAQSAASNTVTTPMAPLTLSDLTRRSVVAQIRIPYRLRRLHNRIVGGQLRE